MLPQPRPADHSDETSRLHAFLYRNLWDNAHFWAIAATSALGGAIVYLYNSGPSEITRNVLSGILLLGCFGAVIYLVGRHVFVRLQTLNDGVTVQAKNAAEQATAALAIGQQCAQSLGNVERTIDRIACQLERTNTDRTLTMLDHVETVGVTAKRPFKTDKDFKTIGNDAAQQISHGFSHFCGVPIKVCIKLLERPASLVGEWVGKLPVERIFVSRIGVFPSVPSTVESRIPLTESYPLQQLYMVDELPHFLENDMSTLRHVRTHTSTLGSLHVARITSSDCALGFLWLESENKAAFDEILVPKLASAFAAKLVPFLSQSVVTTDQLSISVDRGKAKER